MPINTNEVAGGISIQVGTSVEETWNSMDIISWPEHSGLAVRSWPTAGCYDVYERVTSTKLIMMCEFYKADAYRFEFVRKFQELRDLHTDASIIRGPSHCEKASRAKAIDLSNQTNPLGPALLKVFNEHVQLWNVLAHHLQLIKGSERDTRSRPRGSGGRNSPRPQVAFDQPGRAGEGKAKLRPLEKDNPRRN